MISAARILRSRWRAWMRLTGRRPQRIGLSATVKPIEEVACLLGPDTRIVDIGHRREMDLAVEVPRDELGSVASTEMWGEIYDRIAELILAHRTTLVFVNTRRLSERVAHALANGSAERRSSASRQPVAADAAGRRIAAEDKANCAPWSRPHRSNSASISARVDLVCQIGSPRSIAVALQRIGRSGHWVGAKPKGRLFATTRDELIECAALVSAIRAGRPRTPRRFPRTRSIFWPSRLSRPRAAEAWKEDDLYARFRSAYPYRNLPREDFDAVVEMLSEGIATSRGRSGALLHRDRVNGRVKGRRGARLAAITSGGAIPENANYTVIAEPEGKTVGTLDEISRWKAWPAMSFCWAPTPGGSSACEPGRVRVEDAHGAAPSIPFWLGEAPGRSRELSAEVARVRERIVADRGTCAGVSACPNAASMKPARGRRPPMYAPGLPNWARCRLRTRLSPNASSTRPAACNLSCMRPSGRASSAPGVWRCASASAALSISNCRPPPPTTGSCSRSASSTRFRSSWSSRS